MTGMSARGKWGLNLRRPGLSTRREFRVLASIGASFFVALSFNILICLLPNDPYQRWQLVDGTIFEPLRWSFERIHFDGRPVDVAIVGDSKTLVGLSAEYIEERLSALGAPAHVANFSVAADGRNIDWAVLNELYKIKSPKVIVVGVDDAPYPWGHPAFKYIAPAGAIAFPPALLLHNYFYDLAYLPARQLRLFAARFFPDLFGLRRRFDPNIYAHTRSDFTNGRWVAEGKTVDMEAEVPAQTLMRELLPAQRPTRVDRILLRCCNDGDDHVYIRGIAKIARAHGAQLVFVHVPVFSGSEEVADRVFLSEYGLVFNPSDIGDFLYDSKLYESPRHLNHAGAVKLSDRLAVAIASLKAAN
jgi:hypothetical protein